MAKRVIVPENEVLRYYRSKNLLTPPEVFELSDLDMEMSNVLNRTDLTVREKASRYNQALAKFKAIYSDVFNNRRIERHPTDRTKVPAASQEASAAAFEDRPPQDGAVGDGEEGADGGEAGQEEEGAGESDQESFASAPTDHDEAVGDEEGAAVGAPVSKTAQSGGPYKWERKLGRAAAAIHDLLKGGKEEAFHMFENSKIIALRGVFNMKSTVPASDFVTAMNYLFSRRLKSLATLKFTTGTRRPKLIRDLTLAVVQSGAVAPEDVGKKYPNFSYYVSLPKIQKLLHPVSPHKAVRKIGVKKPNYSMMARRMLLNKVAKLTKKKMKVADVDDLAPNDFEFATKRVVDRKRRSQSVSAVPVLGSGVRAKVDFDGWNNECNFSF